MSRLSAIIAALVICALVCLGWAVNHYRDNAITYKDQRDKATEKLNQANATIADMTTRQRNVAALDAKYTKELADAQEIIDRLHNDVVAGRKRLQLNATCKGNSSSTVGMGNASGPRLTDSAQRDYFTLRERIVTVTKQVSYLQYYVRSQCLQ